jgi:hypothetical protein
MAVEQREAVVADQGVEVVVAQQGHHDVGAARCQTYGRAQALLLHAEQLVEGATLLGHVVEIGGIFWIMQMQQINT